VGSLAFPIIETPRGLAREHQHRSVHDRDCIATLAHPRDPPAANALDAAVWSPKRPMIDSPLQLIEALRPGSRESRPSRRRPPHHGLSGLRPFPGGIAVAETNFVSRR
jgi:hypothetical protein